MGNKTVIFFCQGNWTVNDTVTKIINSVRNHEPSQPCLVDPGGVLMSLTEFQ